MSDSSRAVFLSYASQDAEAAQRICDALRAAGVEVWFDQNELVGGDSWDQKIRGQIGSCALFVPLISANTQSRLEGYFRLEWKLAAQRTHTMADEKTFLLPVVIDATRDAEAKVPPEFKTVQWTKLPGGETPEKFCARVKALLGGGEVAPASSRQSAEAGKMPALPRKQSARPWSIPAIIGVGLLVAVAAFLALRPRRSPEEIAKLIASAQTVAVNAAAKSAPVAVPLTEAQQLVAKARKVWEEGDEINRETYALVEELLVRAEERDPAEASAWAFHAWVSAFSYGFALGPEAKRLEAFRMQAERASKLAPGTMEAELAAGALRFGMAVRRGQDLTEPMRQLRELAAKYPNDSRVVEQLGKSLTLVNLDESIAVLEQALTRQPDNPRLKAALINAYYQNGRISEAEACVQRWIGGPPVGRIVTFDVHFKCWWRGDLKGATEAIDRWPQWLLLEDRGIQRASLAYLWKRDATKLRQLAERFPRDYVRDTLFTGPRSVLIAWAHELAGRDQEAKAEWRTTLQITERELAAEPGELHARYWKTWAQARLGDSVAAEAGLKLLEEDAAASNSPVVTAGLAGLQITLGHSDRAFTTLQARVGNAGLGARPITKAQLTLSPVFDPLRGDPRFQALIEAAPGPEEKKENASAGAAALDSKSVAVLAFADLSAAHDSEYFSDGISEELLNVLAKVPGLKVTARTSAFFFKGKNLPIPEIAQKLGVAYVIEGSVQRAGERVKITAQLIKAVDGFHMWSDTFTRDAKDVFAVEEEIAGLIAKQLSLTLGVSSAAATASVNPQAFELYVQGRQAWNLRTDEGFSRAETLLTRAIELEPDFARAHAAIADVWSLRGQVDNTLSAFGLRESPAAARVAAKCELALKLDPRSAEAHASLGLLYWNIWRFAESERELRAAVQLNANYASAHQWLGRTLLMEGRMDDALVELKQATELDPLSPRILDNYAWALSFAGRYREAIEFCDRGLALQGTAIQAAALKAVTLAEMGRLDEAAELARSLPEKESRYSMFRVIVLGRAGKFAEVEKSLDDFVEGAVISKVAGLFAIKRFDEAFAAFDPAWIVSARADYLLFHPVFDPMRGDPRFQKLLATLGLIEAHVRAQAWRKAHPPEKPEAKK